MRTFFLFFFHLQPSVTANVKLLNKRLGLTSTNAPGDATPIPPKADQTGFFFEEETGFAPQIRPMSNRGFKSCSGSVNTDRSRWKCDPDIPQR